MIKIIYHFKIKSRKDYIKILDEEIETLTRDFQRVLTKLEDLQPEEDKALNSYFKSMKKYLDEKDATYKETLKEKMKEEEEKYKDICTQIRWQCSSKNYINSRLNSVISEKTKLEDEIEVLKFKLAKK